MTLLSEIKILDSTFSFIIFNFFSDCHQASFITPRKYVLYSFKTTSLEIIHIVYSDIGNTLVTEIYQR